MVRPILPLLVALLALAAPTAAAPDAVDEAIAAFQDRMKLASDPQARAYAVFELAPRKDARVVEALKPLLLHADLEVRVAAARSIGEQGVPAVAATLGALFGKGEEAKPPDTAFLRALLEGMGEADAKGSYRELKKAAWRWIVTDLPTATAAAEAMAMARSGEAVEDLIELLAQTEKRALQQDDDFWRNAFRGMGDVVRRDLQKLTGKHIQAIKDWRDWWKDNGKGWKPPAPGAEPAPADEKAWGDDAGKFTLRCPSKVWKRTDPGGGVFHAEARAEGKVVAWFNVAVTTASELANQTATAMAAEQKTKIEVDWRDVRQEATRWSQKIPFGGEKAVVHEIAGQHKEYGACTMRHLYAAHDGVMYFVSALHRVGKDDPLRKDFQALFDSFRFR